MDRSINAGQTKWAEPTSSGCHARKGTFQPVGEVGRFRTREEAELAQASLAMAGIRSLLEVDGVGDDYPFDFSGVLRLLVDEGDVGAALTVLSGRLSG